MAKPPEMTIDTDLLYTATISTERAATPDHILTTKRLPLWVDAGDPSDPEATALDFPAQQVVAVCSRADVRQRIEVPAGA